MVYGLGLWCLMPLSTIFQLYRGGQFYWWRKLEYQEKNHQPVASHRQTLSYNVVLSTPRLGGVWTHNVSGDRHWLHRLLVVINPSTIRSRPRRPLYIWYITRSTYNIWCGCERFIITILTTKMPCPPMNMVLFGSTHTIQPFNCITSYFVEFVNIVRFKITTYICDTTIKFCISHFCETWVVYNALMEWTSFIVLVQLSTI